MKVNDAYTAKQPKKVERYWMHCICRLRSSGFARMF